MGNRRYREQSTQQNRYMKTLNYTRTTITVGFRRTSGKLTELVVDLRYYREVSIGLQGLLGCYEPYYALFTNFI